MALFEQHHFSGVGELGRGQSVEVHAAGYGMASIVTSIPAEAVIPGILVLSGDQGSHLLSQQVVDY